MLVQERQKEPRSLNEVIHVYMQNPSQETLTLLVSSGKGLVVHFARLYAGDQPMDDLLQAGYEGLVKAAGRFDPHRGVLFSTYASHYIMGEIRHWLRQESSFERPAWMAEVQSKVYAAMDRLLQEKGQPPSLEEISKAVNIREEGVREILKAGHVSLEEVDISKIKQVSYESFQLVIEDRIALRQGMEKLSKIQQQVIYYIFFRDLNQTQTGLALGIGQRQVSRLLRRGLDSLAHQFRKKEGG